MSSLTSRDGIVDDSSDLKLVFFSFKKWNPLFVFKFTLLFIRWQIILFFIFYLWNPQIKICLLVVRKDFLRNWIWKREKHASANLQVVTRIVFRKQVHQSMQMYLINYILPSLTWQSGVNLLGWVCFLLIFLFTVKKMQYSVW